MKKVFANQESVAFVTLVSLLSDYNSSPIMNLLPEIEINIEGGVTELVLYAYEETLRQPLYENEVEYAYEVYKNENDIAGYTCIFESFRKKILDAYRDIVFTTISSTSIIKEDVSYDSEESIIVKHKFEILEMFQGRIAHIGTCMKVKYDTFDYTLVFTGDSVIVINPISGETTIVPLNNDTVKEVFYTLEYMLY